MKTTTHFLNLPDQNPVSVRVIDFGKTILFYVIMEQLRTDQQREWVADLVMRLKKPHHSDPRIIKAHCMA